MKVIKESKSIQYEVGFIPAGLERYKTLEEPIGVFEDFDAAKECVLSYNHIINTEYAGYDVVIVTSDDDYKETDWASDTEVYRLSGIKLNESALNEGPIKRFFKGIGKSADEKAKLKRSDEEKKAQGKSEKVLAKDFTSAAKNWLYYVPNENGKYPATPISNKDFLRMVGESKPGTPEYKQRCDALVVDKDGMYIRRGLEWLEGKGAKANPAAPKIKPSFTHDEVFTGSSESDEEGVPVAAGETPPEAVGEERPVETPEAPVEKTSAEEHPETPAEETPAESTDTYKKFALLAKATGIKITNARGQIIKNLKTLRKINAENAGNLKVEVDGKTYELPAYIEMLKSNKLLENVVLTEKAWKYTINKEVAFRLRDILEADQTDYEALRGAIKACYDDIHAAMPEVFDEDDCNDAKEELDWLSTSADDSYADFDDPDYMDDDELESEWNYALEDLYDLCDGLSIWIPVRGLDEGLANANAYKIVYHKNTACRDRRPETPDDVENDWIEAPVRADSDLHALQRAIAISRKCNIEDLDYCVTEDACLKYLREDDWGFGSPIIIKVEGPDGVLFDTGYTKESWIEEFCEAEENDEDDYQDIDEIDSFVEDEPEGDVKYDETGSVLIQYKGKGRTFVIPNTVITINEHAFADNYKLTSIIIPNSVTTIKHRAFANCKKLKSIEIPSSVTSIGCGAFNGCTGLTNVVIGNGITNISDFIFDDCYNLTSVNIPEGVTSIGWAAFRNCRKLKNLNIPGSVTDIGEDAFKGTLINYKNESVTLTEAPIINLNDADIMNPGKVDFKQKIADATAEEEAEKARQAEEARKEQFRVKYKDVPAKLEASLGKGGDAEETLKVLFADLVPGQGAADTVAGEMVRAMMRVLYRDFNDGDKFFMGYGLETCASSVSYLCAHISTIEKRVEKMLEEAFRYEDDDRYTEALKEMTEDVVDHIMNNQELIFTPNEDDSRDYDYSYIEENQPRYEFECDGSDDVCTLVDHDVINGWDLYHYVEDQLQWDHAYDGAEVERPWGYDSTSITVSNLTIEGYEQLKDSFERNSDGWWEDLVSEHKEELERINNDEYDEDDDIDEGLTKARPELQAVLEKLNAQSRDLEFLANEFDKALAVEGFDYEIDIVEGFKINVVSDTLADIDLFANKFFSRYDIVVEVEDKGDSHNYLLKPGAVNSEKFEGFIDAFKKEESKSELEEDFMRYDDVMQGMMDNASDEEIDSDLRLFKKVAKNLGLKRPEDVVMYVDSEGMYDPTYYAEAATKIDLKLIKCEVGPITLIRESRNGNIWIYFSTKEDADKYIRFVNKENGI